jgi:hypothetical protein
VAIGSVMAAVSLCVIALTRFLDYR